MSRTLSKLSKDILSHLESSSADLTGLYAKFDTGYGRKEIYNTIYRLLGQELAEVSGSGKEKVFSLSEEGKKSVQKANPKKDGVWKIIIFDVPESKRFVRNFIRARLKNLGFKKWQNSIWVSPYALDEDLEKELLELGKKVFIRLIKSTDINLTDDLEKLFE